MHFRFACLAASLLLAGCASDRNKPPAPACTAQTIAGTELARSRDLETCRGAVARWFDAADTGHDGKLSRAEAEAQVRSLFASLDADHDGAITPAEADAAVPRRAPRGDHSASAMEPGGTPPLEGGRPMGRRRGGPSGGSGGGSGGGAMSAGAMASPIMAADADANFRVTLEELLAQAAKSFDWLDRDHDGTVSRDEAVAGLAVTLQREGRGGGGRRGRHRGGS
jgi:hypothetical protein